MSWKRCFLVPRRFFSFYLRTFRIGESDDQAINFPATTRTSTSDWPYYEFCDPFRPPLLWLIDPIVGKQIFCCQNCHSQAFDWSLGRNWNFLTSIYVFCMYLIKKFFLEVFFFSVQKISIKLTSSTWWSYASLSKVTRVFKKNFPFD